MKHHQVDYYFHVDKLAQIGYDMAAVNWQFYLSGSEERWPKSISIGSIEVSGIEQDAVGELSLCDQMLYTAPLYMWAKTGWSIRLGPLENGRFRVRPVIPWSVEEKLEDEERKKAFAAAHSKADITFHISVVEIT